mmetsp:Transcript_3561/g.8800  ORF Transcript_3561/g.8800 Transcript_3561/m.8800 type:complete len:359 (-) Transcript_3561:29-1105(-)
MAAAAFFGGAKAGEAGAAAADAKRKAAASQPWVEKYRPKSVDEVAMQDEVVSVLKKALEGHDMPHLLFYGPPGTGKTSTILAISRQLFGGDGMKQRVLELNASDERGISVVRDKVKAFAQLTANGGTSPSGKPLPGYKIIIMDECDSMTSDAQSALRRTMEAYSKVTRFCLICNYVSRIIDPLASRCAKFRFKPLSLEPQMSRLKMIQGREGVECPDEVLSRLVTYSGGDLRQAITLLQCLSRLRGEGEPITEEDVMDVAGVLPEAAINDLITRCHTNSFEKVQEAVTDIVAAGYSATAVISQLHDALILAPSGEVADMAKARVAERLAKADLALADGADEELQLLNVAAFVMKQLNL